MTMKNNQKESLTPKATHVTTVMINWEHKITPTAFALYLCLPHTSRIPVHNSMEPNANTTIPKLDVNSTAACRC